MAEKAHTAAVAAAIHAPNDWARMGQGILFAQGPDGEIWLRLRPAKKEEAPMSGSGNSKTLATTGGFVLLDNGDKINASIISPLPKHERVKR